MQRQSDLARRPWAWLMGTAIALGGIPPAPLHAQEVQGGIVVIRDVPERHAFLPEAGEALVVKTAPFGDVWSGINPGKVLTDTEANAVVGRWNTARIGVHEITPAYDIVTGSLATGPATLDRGSSIGSGVAGIVDQALDSGLGSLKGGLDQVQAALGSQ